MSKLIDITFGSQVVVSLLIDKRGRSSSTEPDEVLAKDIWDVRSIVGSKYDSGLLDLIDYHRTNFPELMAKGGGQ